MEMHSNVAHAPDKSPIHTVTSLEFDNLATKLGMYFRGVLGSSSPGCNNSTLTFRKY